MPCHVDVLIIIFFFTYPLSIAIHETIHQQVCLQSSTIKRVQKDSFLASCTRTSNPSPIICIHVHHRGLHVPLHLPSTHLHDRLHGITSKRVINKMHASKSYKNLA